MPKEAKPDNQVIKLQDACFVLLNKIQERREKVKSIKTPKSVLVAEAVSMMAEKEFAE